MNQEGNQSVSNCYGLKLEANDGKFYKTDCANRETILWLIQSILSRNAEPFKLWLANAGHQYIEETEDATVLTINRMIKRCTPSKGR